MITFLSKNRSCIVCGVFTKFFFLIPAMILQERGSMNVVVMGAQWGDEGKGKIVDYLAQDAKYVCRFAGGANAGHTIVVDGKKYALHQVWHLL